MVENEKTLIYGWRNNIPYEYNKVAKHKIFFHDVLSVEFEPTWKVRIGKDIVIIEDVIHRLDGSIEYYTNKIIEKIKV